MLPKKAVFFLEFRWQQFHNKYGKLQNQEDWVEAFRRINDWLGDAYYSIDQNEAALAFAHLEHVKYELFYLRQRNEIAYYLDDLYHFQDQLNMLIQISEDPMLELLEWNEWVHWAKGLMDSWKEVQAKELNPTLFEFSSQELAAMQILMDKLTDQLDWIRIEMTVKDPVQLVPIMQQSEKTIIKVIALFGKFDNETAFLVNQAGAL